MGAITADAVRTALNAADFPLDKADVVRCAVEAGADGETQRALDALPLGTYESVDEVVRSIDSAEASGQTGSEKGAQSREDAQPGLAEHERSTAR